jgi:integrase
VRTKELRFATRIEFEGLGTPNAIWRIPAERMKMKREHIVPLSRQAEAIIAEGRADAVFLARAMLRNPRWALNAAEKLGVIIQWPHSLDRARTLK